MKKNLFLGAAEIVAGVLLMSPADEAVVTAGTWGAGATIAPVQLIGTGIAGLYLLQDGLKRL